MILQKLVGNIYSVFIEIILWLIPIASAVSGYILISSIYWNDATYVQLFLGTLGGLVAGLIMDVFLFGPVVLLLNMRASLKNIENKSAGAQSR